MTLTNTNVEVEPLGDSQLFKNPNQNSHWVRNKHYADQVLKDHEFVCPYRVTKLQVGKKEVTGIISKTVGVSSCTVDLSLQIRVQASSVRVTIDEVKRRDGETPITRRYDELDKWTFEEPSYENVEPMDDGSVIPFGDGNELVIQSSPLKFILRRHGVDHMVINSRQLMNFEHYRPKSENQSQLGPHEIDTGMWEDEFMIHKDIKTHGPESVAMDVEFFDFKHVFGIPEHSVSLSLPETDDPYRLFNLDAFEYDIDSPKGLYGAIPLMQAHKQGASVGFFWVNASDTYVEVKKSELSSHSHWVAESGRLDFILFASDTPNGIVENYCKWTGFSQLPQMFSLGYHQCRWNYMNEKELLDVNDGFEEHDIPVDVLWLDIEFSNKKKYFEWDQEAFPDPVGMCRTLEKYNRKLVPIIDPHIKVDETYKLYNDVVKKDLAINSRQGKPFHGHCWPGESIWVDTLNPNAHEYWHTAYEDFIQTSNVHIWNDMNEPSVFNGPENTMDKGAVHFGGWQHRDIHNILGETYHKASFDSLEKVYNRTQRPFVLTRSFFAGSQRYGAAWTGDNMAKWSHLKASLPMIMSMNISGFAQIGADVGGLFFEPSSELLVRWYQVGCLYPFFRAHAHIDTERREPWTRGEPYTSMIRNAIRMRYRLLPVIYTAFYKASTRGTPIMKPMFWDNVDETTLSMDDQFYVGDSGLLIKPVVEEGQRSVELYLPDEEVHYDYATHKRIQGKGLHPIEVPLEKIPLFMRGGHIHARKDIKRGSSEQMVNDPYTLVVAISNETGSAAGELYIDDGKSFAYKSGDYGLCMFEFTDSVLSGSVQGSTNGRLARIEMIGAEYSAVTVEQNGVKCSAKVTNGITDVNVELGKPFSVTFE